MEIAAVLRERIRSGELASSTRMPGTRAIKVEFNTSMETAQKSLRVLENEGLVLQQSLVISESSGVVGFTGGCLTAASPA
jgi:DNA-binding GntR family transcriptional regulator